MNKKTAGMHSAKYDAPIAQNTAQRPAAEFSNPSQEKNKALDIQGLIYDGATSCDAPQTHPVPPRGVEPLYLD